MSLEHSPAREAKSGLTGNVGRVLVSDLELAKILSCSRSTIWRRVGAGDLDAPIKFGGLSRFVLAEALARVEAAKAARDETGAA